MNEESNIEIEITADITEFEKAIDRCTAKTKELIQLAEQANKLLCEEVRN